MEASIGERLAVLEQFLPILEGLQRFEKLKGQNKAESSHLLKSFKAEVRSEILEDFVRLMAGNSEELRLIGDSFEQMQQDFDRISKELDQHQQISCKSISELKQAEKDAVQEIKAIQNNVNIIFTDIQQKVQVENFEELKNIVSNKADQIQVDALQQITNLTAKADDLNKIKDFVQRIDTELKEYLKLEDIQKELLNRKFAKVDHIANLDSSMKKTMQQQKEFLNEKLQVNYIELQQCKKISRDLLQQIQNKPWEEAMQECNRKILEKLDCAAFHKLRLKVIQKIKNFEDIFTNQTDEIYTLSGGLERLDEILLTKSSKADYMEMKQKLNDYLETEKYLKEIAQMKKQIKTLKTTQSKLQVLLNKVAQDVDGYTISPDGQKRERRDFAIVKQQINDLVQTVNEKSNKSDLLQLIDSLCYKDDLKPILRDIKCIQKQLKNALELQSHILSSPPINQAKRISRIELGDLNNSLINKLKRHKLTVRDQSIGESSVRSIIGLSDPTNFATFSLTPKNDRRYQIARPSSNLHINY